MSRLDMEMREIVVSMHTAVRVSWLRCLCQATVVLLRQSLAAELRCYATTALRRRHPAQTLATSW